MLVTTKMLVIALLCVVYFTCSSHCQAMCPPLERHLEVELECIRGIGGRRVNCNDAAADGTIVYYKCKNQYRPSKSTNNYMRMVCRNGFWLGEVGYRQFKCETDCGNPSNPYSSYIVGGIPTQPQFWPWHATIFLRGKSSTFQCGGSLINRFSVFAILTAAHCIASNRRTIDPKSIQVILGASSSNYLRASQDSRAQVFGVTEISIPDDFVDTSGAPTSDIALLFLDKPIKLTRFVSPVCLPDEAISKLVLTNYGGFGEVVGFGAVNNISNYSDRLRYTRLQLISPIECFQTLGTVHKDSQFCAGFETGTAVCKGDSGGGFVGKFGNVVYERFYIQGVVSYGKINFDKQSCESYTIFTRVQFFNDWIAEKMDYFSFKQFRATTATPSTTTTTTTTTVSTTTTITPTTTSQPPSTQNDWRQMFIDTINFYRAKHGAPPVSLNDTMTKDAQNWANYVARTGSGLLKPNSPYGQNVYRYNVYGFVASRESVIRQAVDRWYQSKSGYDPNNPKESSFTQLVWKASTKVGVGYANYRGTYIANVFYKPAGNVFYLGSNRGKFFHANVQP